MSLLLTILPNVNIHLIIGRENLKILEKIDSFYWSYLPLLLLDNLIDVDDTVICLCMIINCLSLVFMDLVRRVPSCYDFTPSIKSKVTSSIPWMVPFPRWSNHGDGMGMNYLGYCLVNVLCKEPTRIFDSTLCHV